MKKSIVIGANSFIGQCLIENLKDTAVVTGIYHKNTDKLTAEGVQYIPYSELTSITKDFDDVYLLSASIHTSPQLDARSRSDLFKSNVEQVAEICSHFSDSKIVYSSSVSVYNPSEELITEASCPGATNEYGLSKYWGEKIIKKNSRYAIVRFPSVYGPGMKTNTIIPIYINQALQKRQITVWGDGARLQNYLHVTDAARYLMAAANLEENDVFLAVSQNSVSNKALAGIIAAYTSADIAFTGTDITPSISYNNNYSRDRLGYTSSTSLEEGIKQMIKWIEKEL